MARLALNKATLQQQLGRLKTFQQFLPSLDLKRRQLLAERVKARAEARAARTRLEQLLAGIGAELPMFADERVDLGDLLDVTDVRIGEQNRLGVKLPTLDGFEVAIRDYPMLGRPHWVDRLADLLREAAALTARATVHEERLARLERAVRTITQRVNLFEKVLIPETRDNVRRIRLFLSDAERAAVVRAKIAKTRRTGGAA